jgi:predicted MFS family arabinose efflux permease
VRRSRRQLFLAVAAGLALADASVVTLALPRLLTELHATVEGVAAVIGVYTVVLAVALLPAERLRRRHGARRLGAVGLALFAVACIGCAAAGSLELLLALRALQALGGAAALVAAFDLLGAGSEGSAGWRLWSTAAVVGFAAGPALGGVLTQLFDWRSIFVAQVPIAVAGAAAALLPSRAPGPDHAGRDEPADKPARPPHAGRGPMAALALLSAALTAVLFLLVLLLVAGWNEEPLVAALAVSVLPAAALLTRNAGGDPHMRAATGCVLVAAGTLCLAFLPLASPWWTLVPQLLAGAGIGLALPALAGELIPERDPNDAARLLTARHAGIALALLVLAPVVASNLDSATERAKERGVAILLDSSLPPQDKIELAPDLLDGVNQSEPRRGLERAIDRNRNRVTGDARAEYDRLAAKADDTLVEAVAESFRIAFVITAALALLGALAVLPSPARRRSLARLAVAAAAVPVVYVLLYATLSPTPVKIADPCKKRTLPHSGGISGLVQDVGLNGLDRIACQFGSSREQLVLGLADPAERARYKREHGVDPRAGGNLLQGLLGGG